MSKYVYVGPTIIGVATRNTTYAEIPASLQEAIKTAPFLAGLCIPISKLSDALVQIRNKSGAIYTLYQKALNESAKLKGEI